MDKQPIFFQPDQKLLALSWKQPYADLMLFGKIETRTWPTNYRGCVLICSSKTEYDVGQVDSLSVDRDQMIKIIETVKKINPPHFQLKGKAIAIGILVDCRPMTPEDEEKCFVKYRPGLFCHVYKHVMPIHPFDWKGSQKWRIVSDEIKKSIRFLALSLTRKCRVCGCTDFNCEVCIQKIGEPCYWVEEDLCSACVEES